MRQLGSRHGTVALEFALIAVFFLLPVLAGAADFVVVLTAQAQLNTALQALYYYALTNPSAAVSYTSATTTAEQAELISLINSNSTFPITLTPTGSVTSGKTTITTNSYLQTACVPPAPTSLAPLTVNAALPTCANDLQIYVTYQVTTIVNLPFPLPLPGLKNPMSLSASGAVQVQ